MSFLHLADFSGAFWFAAVAAVLLTGISKGGFGSAIGVAATPILALTISAADAVALLLPLLLVADLFALRQYRRQIDSRVLKMLLPGAVVGIGLGWLFFDYFSDNESVLKMAIGVLALGFVVFQMLRNRFVSALFEQNIPGGRADRMQGGFWGMTSGFVSTLAHVGGPPVLVYLLPKQLPRELFVGTTVLFFLVVNLVKLVPYSQLGLLRVENLAVVALLAPLAWIGVKLGVLLNRRFTDLWFTRVIYVVLTLTGFQLVFGAA